MKIFKTSLVVILWLLPAWLVWQVASTPELQHGLNDGQVGILAWYPLIAVLMIFFATVLYRRLPVTWFGLCAYVIGAIGLPALHWWLGKSTSLTLLIAEWATYSLTLFVLGFSVELFRRIFMMAKRGHWWLVVFGGLANLAVFVAPGVLISISLYLMLYQQGLFRASLLLQVPYLLALMLAVWYEWRSFRAM